MLLCLDQGIEEAHHFFSRPDWGLRIGAQEHEMRIAQLHVNQHTLNVWEHPMRYRLHKWKAFDPENYEHYNTLKGIAEQFSFLERLLATHVIAFASGVGWNAEPRFEVKITDLLKKEWIEHKGIKMLAFTLEFEANVSLPDFVGLGKGAGVGFGVVRRQGKNKYKQKTGIKMFWDCLSFIYKKHWLQIVLAILISGVVIGISTKYPKGWFYVGIYLA